MLYFWDSEIAFPTLEQVELYRRVEQENDKFDIWEMWPFGASLITDTSVHSHDGEARALYQEVPEGEPHWPMPLDMVNCFLDELRGRLFSGERLFTWNGTGFDYQLLARLTGRYAECAELCVNSYDPCFQALCMQGFPVGLDPAARAMGFARKEMEGASAPLLWPTERWAEVVEYGKNDAIRLKQVVLEIMRSGGLRWITRKGGLMCLPMPKFLTVKQCLQIPFNPPYWVTDPLIPTEVVKWWDYKIGVDK